MITIIKKILIFFMPIEWVEYTIFELRGKLGRLLSTNLKSSSVTDLSPLNYFKALR